MSLKYIVLSLVALFAISVLILKNYETWTRSFEATPERSTAKKQEAKVTNPQAPSPPKVPGSAQSHAIIAGKNIFSPDRKDFPVQSVESKKIVRPQIVLYGVTIGEGYQFASIVNPGRSLIRGERETLSLKVGDKVGDYKLAKISFDRISLEAEGDTFDVLLYDPKAPKKRTEVKTETKPATITSSQPQAAAAPATGPAAASPPTPSVTSKPIPPPPPAPQVVSPRGGVVPSTPSASPYTPPYRRGRVISPGQSPGTAPTGTSSGTPPAGPGPTEGGN